MEDIMLMAIDTLGIPNYFFNNLRFEKNKNIKINIFIEHGNSQSFSM